MKIIHHDGFSNDELMSFKVRICFRQEDGWCLHREEYVSYYYTLWFPEIAQGGG